MASTLKRVAIALPVGYTIGWMAYYAYTDTTRRRVLWRRQEKYLATLATLPESSKPGDVASTAEIAAIKERYASLWIAGRLWNVTPEWREQGAWEWALWKLLISTVTLKLFYNGGVPLERPIPDLPIERPNFQLLFGSSDPTSSSQADPLTSKAFPQSQSFASTSPQVSVSPLASLADLENDGMAESWVDVKAEVSSEEIPPPVKASSGSDESIEVTDKLTITWIGQSTSFVTMEGLCVLTDPIFSDQTLPSVVAPYRLRPPPCRLDELKKVDVVLVSHNHFDHLDPLAIQELGDSVQWLVPLGVGKFIREQGVTRVTEMDWWQEEEYTLKHPRKPDQSFKITALPLMHWSARSPLDTNATLWAAFHVKSASPKGTSFLHLGDTGYSPSLFSAIGRVTGPVDLAAIPIGSYEPRWHMHLQHTDPEGAVRMAQDMNIKKSIPVHWGTWLMSDEAYNKPPIDLAIARQKLGVKEEDFGVVPVGKTVVVE